MSSLPYLLDPAERPPQGEPRRLLAEDGLLVTTPSHLPADAQVLRAYRLMRFVRLLDEQMLNAQRTGRISFYGSCTGQEAAVIGSALALDHGDLCVPALREGAAALLRGYPFQDYMDQLFGNDRDRCRGRQMPCHYSDRAIGHLSLSSPVANQLPQAIGMAYAERLRKSDRVVLAYCGDGGTAEADFAIAMNFGRIWQVPAIIFCQNNQWAISTPAERQGATPTIVERADAYGMHAERVDGNDLLAVYEVTSEAVARARAGEGPTFIEALTYRVGAHSTSDDPSRYRDESVTETWATERDPIRRLRAWLLERGLLGPDDDARMDEAFLAAIKAAATASEERRVPPPSTLFSDVFAVPPPLLRRQAVGAGADTVAPALDRSRAAGPAPWDRNI